eukprot:m.133086 g.133086  ORF g.133086 m.133086 type:complete len:216 (+) comp9491_c0_seq3:4761-5408(+)
MMPLPPHSSHTQSHPSFTRYIKCLLYSQLIMVLYNCSRLALTKELEELEQEELEQEDELEKEELEQEEVEQEELEEEQVEQEISNVDVKVGEEIERQVKVERVENMWEEDDSNVDINYNRSSTIIDNNIEQDTMLRENYSSNDENKNSTTAATTTTLRQRKFDRNRSFDNNFDWVVGSPEGEEEDEVEAEVDVTIPTSVKRAQKATSTRNNEKED